MTVVRPRRRARTLLDVLGIADPRKLDAGPAVGAARTQGRQWMRFPVGTFTDTGEVAELDLQEGSQRGMGMHSLFIGTTGAGKSEGIITEVAAPCLTHSPEVVNIVFSDFKLKSAAGMMERFPHVVAAVSNLADERHLVGRLYDALDGELDRRGAMIAALDDCPDVTTYNQRRLTDPSLPPIPALWVISDEYNEMFADPIWGRSSAACSAHRARGPLAARVLAAGRPDGGHPESARHPQAAWASPSPRAPAPRRSRGRRSAIRRAAHIAPEGEEGTAYLRVALREPRKFRYFYTSADFVPDGDGSDAGRGSARGRARGSSRGCSPPGRPTTSTAG